MRYCVSTNEVKHYFVTETHFFLVRIRRNLERPSVVRTNKRLTVCAVVAAHRHCKGGLRGTRNCISFAYHFPYPASFFLSRSAVTKLTSLVFTYDFPHVWESQAEPQHLRLVFLLYTPVPGLALVSHHCVFRAINFRLEWHHWWSSLYLVMTTRVPPVYVMVVNV